MCVSISLVNKAFLFFYKEVNKVACIILKVEVNSSLHLEQEKI